MYSPVPTNFNYACLIKTKDFLFQNPFQIGNDMSDSGRDTTKSIWRFYQRRRKKQVPNWSQRALRLNEISEKRPTLPNTMTVLKIIYFLKMTKKGKSRNRKKVIRKEELKLSKQVPHRSSAGWARATAPPKKSFVYMGSLNWDHFN